LAHTDYLREFPFLGVPNTQPADDDAGAAPRETFV
jgi:hypothetical protein